MPRNLRLLLIEDSEEDALILLRELKKADYDITCRRVERLADLESSLLEQWDLIVSDYNLPGFLAPDALKMTQEKGVDLPFIIVSGMIGEETAVAAMKAGAHDYMMKGNLQRLPPAIERELREAEERRKRKEAEKAIITQFSQISAIFDSLNVLVYVADLESNKLIYLNKQGAMLVGKSWEGLNFQEVLQPSGHTGENIPGSRLVENGQPTEPHVWEFQNRGTSRWYQCIDRAIQWPDDRMVRMGVAIDITERKEMERLKDEMLSAVSHEMRTPLTAMLGFTEFLLENDVTPEQLAMSLSTIHKETERLHELISNFLDLQKHKARRETYCFDSLATRALLQEAADLFAGGTNTHPIEIVCPDDIPAVMGDEGKIHQVLNNLISNACKYSPEKAPITLGASADSDLVRISVADKGNGIPPEMRERIFEKFYRIDNNDRRQTGGTGLGLALVKEIVSAHSGRVWVEENPGGGSLFCIEIPRAA